MGRVETAPEEPGSGPEPISVERFLVRGNDFLVAGCQDVFVMATPHTHSQIELNYVIAGRIAYRHGGRDTSLHSGEFALFWGAVPHQTFDVEPGTRYVCIYLPLERFLEADLSGRLRSAVLDGGLVVCDEPARFEASTMQRLVDDARDADDPRILALIADEVLLALRRLDLMGWSDRLAGQHPHGRMSAGVMPAKILEMTRFIAEHGHEAITVAEVASAAGLHPNYAMTRFRTFLGMTIANYILRHRMMAAQTLLVSTRKDIAAIAFETGFGSVSQFHRSFRGHFACTPAEFRRRMSLPSVTGKL